MSIHIFKAILQKKNHFKKCYFTIKLKIVLMVLTYSMPKKY